MTRCVFGVLLLAMSACGGTQTAAQSAGAVEPQSADAVVAEIGGRKITLKELDEKWQVLNPGERARVTQLLYQNRRNVLDQMLADLLVDDAAKAAGMSRSDYLEKERAKRVTPVTEDDIKQLFEANKDRAQGLTLEQLRGQISEYLSGQREQQAHAQLVDELKRKRGESMRVTLEPPRQTVELAAHDPAIGPATAPVTLVEFSDYQ